LIANINEHGVTLVNASDYRIGHLSLIDAPEWGAFTCVGWQVTLCDPMWQLMSRVSEMGFPGRVISACRPCTFLPLCGKFWFLYWYNVC